MYAELPGQGTYLTCYWFQMQSLSPEHLCHLLLFGNHLAFLRLYVFSDPSLSLPWKGTAGSGHPSSPCLWLTWFTGWQWQVMSVLEASPRHFNGSDGRTHIISGSKDRENCCSETQKYLGIQIITQSHLGKTSKEVPFFTLWTKQKHGIIHKYNITELEFLKLGRVKHSFCLYF